MRTRRGGVRDIRECGAKPSARSDLEEPNGAEMDVYGRGKSSTGSPLSRCDRIHVFYRPEESSSPSEYNHLL